MQDKVEQYDSSFDFQEWIKDENDRHDKFIFDLVQEIMEITERKLKNREDD